MALLRAIFFAAVFRRVRWWPAACLLATGLLAAPALRADAPTQEYQLKAVYLYNFTQFVVWPATAYADEHAPIVIGILGEDPFGSYLDELVHAEKVGERAITVRRFRTVEEVTGCQVLFISQSEAGSMDKSLARLRDRMILTVGDTDNFNRDGGMIRLVLENGKKSDSRVIRLRINIEAAKAAGLTVSSKLLRWATIVPPGKD